MKIVFIVNGLGLGNSTRCHAIIQRLHSLGARIEIITSGNGLWYFNNKTEVECVHEIETIAYGSKNGSISIGRTFSSILKMTGVLFRNSRRIGEFLDDIEPDVVVSDSDYNFLPIKCRKIPLVALNNADFVWDSFFEFKDTPQSIRPQFYGIEMLDYWYHKLIPELVVSPSLVRRLTKVKKNIFAVGPIVRKEYVADPRSGPVTRAVVMLSGSVFGTPVNLNSRDFNLKIDVIGREAPEGRNEEGSLTYHGKLIDSYPLLKLADVVVVNGGFSAVSEMFWMKKPLVVVPVPRHAEQWVNAKRIEVLGVGLMATPQNYQEVLKEIISKIDLFRDAYTSLPAIEDGAAHAAQLILNLMRK